MRFKLGSVERSVDLDKDGVPLQISVVKKISFQRPCPIKIGKIYSGIPSYHILTVLKTF
jgi:hypothetical protein